MKAKIWCLRLLPNLLCIYLIGSGIGFKLCIDPNPETIWHFYSKLVSYLSEQNTNRAASVCTTVEG